MSNLRGIIGRFSGRNSKSERRGGGETRGNNDNEQANQQPTLYGQGQVVSQGGLSPGSLENLQVEREVQKTNTIIGKFSSIYRPGWAGIMEALQVIVREWEFVEWVGIVLRNESQGYATMVQAYGTNQSSNNGLESWQKMDSDSPDVPPEKIVQWCQAQGLGSLLCSILRNVEGQPIGWLIAASKNEVLTESERMDEELDRVAHSLRSSFLKTNVVKASYLLADMYCAPTLNEVVKIVLGLLKEHCPQQYFSLGFISQNWKFATLFCCPERSGGQLLQEQVATEVGVIGKCITMKRVVAVEDFSEEVWMELPCDVEAVCRMLGLNVRKSRLLLMPFILRGRTLGGLFVMSTNDSEDFDDLKGKLSSILILLAAQFYDIITVKFDSTWRSFTSPQTETLGRLSMDNPLGPASSVASAPPAPVSSPGRHKHGVKPPPLSRFPTYSQQSLQNQQLPQSSLQILQRQVQPQQASQKQAQQVQLNFLRRAAEPTSSDTKTATTGQGDAQPQTAPLSFLFAQVQGQQVSEGEGLRRTNSLPTSGSNSTQSCSGQQDNGMQGKEEREDNLDEQDRMQVPTGLSESPLANFHGIPPALGQLQLQGHSPLFDNSRSMITSADGESHTSEFEVSVEFSVSEELVKHGGTIEADFPFDLIRKSMINQNEGPQEQLTRARPDAPTPLLLTPIHPPSTILQQLASTSNLQSQPHQQFQQIQQQDLEEQLVQQQPKLILQAGPSQPGRDLYQSSLDQCQVDCKNEDLDEGLYQQNKENQFSQQQVHNDPSIIHANLISPQDFFNNSKIGQLNWSSQIEENVVEKSNNNEIYGNSIDNDNEVDDSKFEFVEDFTQIPRDSILSREISNEDVILNRSVEGFEDGAQQVDELYYPKSFEQDVVTSQFLDEKLECLYRRWYNESNWGSDVFYRCLTLVMCITTTNQTALFQEPKIALANMFATTFLEGAILGGQLLKLEEYIQYRSVVLSILRLVRMVGCSMITTQLDPQLVWPIGSVSSRLNRMLLYGLPHPAFTVAMPDVPHIHAMTLVIWVLVLVFYAGPIICIRHFEGENFYMTMLNFSMVQVVLGVVLPLFLARYLDSRQRKEFLLSRYGVRNHSGSGVKEMSSKSKHI